MRLTAGRPITARAFVLAGLALLGGRADATTCITGPNYRIVEIEVVGEDAAVPHDEVVAWEEERRLLYIGRDPDDLWFDAWPAWLPGRAVPR